MVEDFNHRLRVDDVAGNHGPDFTRGNALWQPSRSAVSRHLGLHTLAVPWHIMQWLVIILLLLFSFALLYRFAPNLKDRRWQWSTPGAVVAVVWWVGSILFLRISQEHFSSSQRTYAEMK